MRDNPGFTLKSIADCLDAQYGIEAAEIAFLPIGHDMNSFVYKVVAVEGDAYFLKIRTDPVYQLGLLVPRALIDNGSLTVLAPLGTRASGISAALEGHDG